MPWYISVSHDMLTLLSVSHAWYGMFMQCPIVCSESHGMLSLVTHGMLLSVQCHMLLSVSHGVLLSVSHGMLSLVPHSMVLQSASICGNFQNIKFVKISSSFIRIHKLEGPT